VLQSRVHCAVLDAGDKGADHLSKIFHVFVALIAESDSPALLIAFAKLKLPVELLQSLLLGLNGKLLSFNGFHDLRPQEHVRARQLPAELQSLLGRLRWKVSRAEV